MIENLRRVLFVILLILIFPTYAATNKTFSFDDPTLFLENFQDIVEEYQKNSNDEFVKSIPSEMVVLQAAIESGYGQSLYARKANNFFGIYTPYKKLSYKKIRQTGTKLYVKQFASATENIEDYFNLLKHERYNKFHIRLKTTKNPILLLSDIVSVYSETKPVEYLSMAKQIYRRYFI